MTKNLVVCCDGTWKNSSDEFVSNVEKIARSIAPTGPDGEAQVVHYARGVGSAGSGIERKLAGAFGYGLDAAIVDCYRFLALNYEPGDRIFIFGFSRGAYTARSLCGMIAHTGLLTPMGVARGQLPVAMRLYRSRPRPDKWGRVRSDPEHDREARALVAHRHPVAEVTIEFLGVFDTVGALGIPGTVRKKYRFHDVALTPMVMCARQALAIAERRRIFVPCLWGGHHLDMQQVWFDGVHTDVGGGYENCFYSDKSMLWMAAEAAGSGQYGGHHRLGIDWARLGTALCAPDDVVENSSMTPWYWLANRIGVLKERLSRTSTRVPRFARGWRTFAPTVETENGASTRAFDVRVESSAIDRAVNPNMASWFDEVKRFGGDPDDLAVVAPSFEQASNASTARRGDAALPTGTVAITPRR